MEKYKKKSFGFSKGAENRDLRAYRRSVDRKNAKYLRLSALRRIDENKDQSVDVCTERHETETANSGKGKQIRKVSPELSRLEMLRKWKEEKLLKKKLEAKKKPFVVSHVSYKPTPTFSSPIKSHGRKTKDNSRLQSFHAGSVSCRTTLQKMGNPQNNNTNPVPTQPSAVSISHSRLPKALGNSKHVHLAYGNRVFLQSSGKQEIHGEETSKPSNSRKNNAFSNHSVSSALQSKSQAGSQLKTPHSFKANNALSGSQPCDKSNSKTVGIQSSSALSKMSNKTAFSNSSAPKGSGKQHKQTQSFAPANFLFKAPLNVEKFIFPNGISSVLLKENSDRGKELNKIHEMDNREDLSSCTLQESNTEDNFKALKTTSVDNSAITETTASTEKVSSTDNSCVMLDITGTTKFEKTPNKVQVAKIEEANKKLFCEHDENVHKATNCKENKSSNEVEEIVKNKENDAVSLALTNGDQMSKNDLETVGDLCGSQKIESVEENLDICEELLYDGKYPSMPQSHNNTVTPRRSRRLASLHQKLGAITKDNSSTLNQSAIPTKLTEKLSILSMNGAGRQSQDESEIKGILPTISEYEENVCSEKLAKRRRERVHQDTKKDKQPNGFDVFHSDCGPYLVGTPTRPITRLQQRKISLLGSPRMSTSLPRKSIKGDLITFSPS